MTKKTDTFPSVESWHHTLKHYQMTIDMLIANMMCRAIPSGGIDYTKAKKALFKTVAEEGKRLCQLEDDEIRKIFQETYSYMEQVFHNQSVCEIARQFADQLKENRSLSGFEMKQILGMLQDF